MYTYRKIILGFSIIFTIIMGYFALQMPSILQGSGFETEGDYAKTNQLLEEEFGQSSSPYIIVFENKTKQQIADFQSYIDSVLKEVNKVDGVSSVMSPLENASQQKESIAYAAVAFNKEHADANENIKQLEKKLNNKDSFTVSLTGGHVIEEEMNSASQSDLKQAEMIGLPVAMIVLLLAFGGLVAASIPLITGVVSVVAAMGIIYFLGQIMNLSVFVLNVAPMIGLAVSIDFALLYINRFREELVNHSVQDAIAITTRTSGRAIAFSGTCVVLGLTGMLFIDIDIFFSVAIGGITVVVLSVISALTFLPALLSILGNNINKLMILKQKETSSKWGAFASFVMKHPIKMILITIVVLFLGMVPIKGIHLEIPNAGSLPHENEARIAFEKFEDAFLPSEETDVPFVIKTKDDVISADSLKVIETFIADLEKDELVDKVDSFYSYSGINSAEELYQTLQVPQAKEKLTPILENTVNDQYTFITVYIKASSTSKEAKKWVKSWAEKTEPDNLSYTVGGRAKFNQEIFSEITEQVPKGIALIIGSTFLILLFAFRSILIPFKAILMNILSLGSAFGIIVWIFQEGNFGIEPSPIALIIPIFTFAIVFGLSMDYEVFLISRIQEIYKKTNDNDYATLQGLTTTSKIITSAAAIMMAVTGAFAFTDIVPVKQVGVAVALSIFIDATLVRMVLVPSLMKLFGDWNWWLPGVKRNKKSSE